MTATAPSLRDYVTPIGLAIPNPAAVGYTEWWQLGQVLGVAGEATRWGIGDWWAFGEARFGHSAAQAADLVGVAEQTMLNRAVTARHIPPQDRRPGLTHYAHTLVQALPRDERNRWLDRAEEGGWNSTMLRGHLAAAGVLTKGNRLKPSEEKPPITPKEALTLMRQDQVWRDIATRALDNAEVTCPECGATFEP